MQPQDVTKRFRIPYCLSETYHRVYICRASRIEDYTPTSVEQIIDIVNRQKASVLYYRIAAGYLYSWLIVPNKGNQAVCDSEAFEYSTVLINVGVRINVGG